MLGRLFYHGRSYGEAAGKSPSGWHICRFRQRTNPAPSRSDIFRICRPAGAGFHFWPVFYKYAAPLALTAQRGKLLLRGNQLLANLKSFLRLFRDAFPVRRQFLGQIVQIHFGLDGL